MVGLGLDVFGESLSDAIETVLVLGAPDEEARGETFLTCLVGVVVMFDYHGAGCAVGYTVDALCGFDTALVAVQSICVFGAIGVAVVGGAVCMTIGDAVGRAVDGGAVCMTIRGSVGMAVDGGAVCLAIRDSAGLAVHVATGAVDIPVPVPVHTISIQDIRDTVSSLFPGAQIVVRILEDCVCVRPSVPKRIDTDATGTLGHAMQELRVLYEPLSDDFRVFYPELQAFAQAQLNTEI